MATWEECNQAIEPIIPPESPSGDCCDKLEAGQGINIEKSADRIIISARGGGGGIEYTAGQNIEIQGDVISAPDVYSESEVNDLLADKADASDVYTKAQVDGKLSHKADKTTVYTKEEVDRIVDELEFGDFTIVDELPETGGQRDIYLVKNEQGSYDEWLYVNGTWELIGKTEPDMEDYYRKSETDTLLAEKQNVLTPGASIKIEDDNISVNPTSFMRTAFGSSNMMAVPAQGKATAAIHLNLPTGFSIAGYRQLSIGNGSGGYGADDCVVRFFSTTGGGVQAQVSVRNVSNYDALIQISVTVFCVKL